MADITTATGTLKLQATAHTIGYDVFVYEIAPGEYTVYNYTELLPDAIVTIGEKRNYNG
jgi:hypothetical protein